MNILHTKRVHVTVCPTSGRWAVSPTMSSYSHDLAPAVDYECHVTGQSEWMAVTGFVRLDRH